MNKIQSNTIMFPPNHNTRVNCVIMGWDDKDKKGYISIEEFYNNAYLDPKKIHNKIHTEKDECIKEFETHVHEIEKVINQQNIDEAYDSETIINCALYKGNGDNLNIRVPSCPINITIKNNKDVLVTIFAKYDTKIKKGEALFIDVTNDPTNYMAGASVSLGYYVWRIQMNKFKVINLDPLQFSCKKKDFERRFSRACLIPNVRFN